MLENTKNLFDNIIKLFDNIDITKPKPNDLNKNIFICGMPRSGTTLIEQMVASHHSVEGAGEIHYLSEIIKNNFLEGIKFNKSKILDEIKNPENLIFKKYNNLISFHNFKSNLVTDKAHKIYVDWIYQNFFLTARLFTVLEILKIIVYQFLKIIFHLLLCLGHMIKNIFLSNTFYIRN